MPLLPDAPLLENLLADQETGYLLPGIATYRWTMGIHQLEHSRMTTTNKDNLLGAQTNLLHLLLELHGEHHDKVETGLWVEVIGNPM